MSRREFSAKVKVAAFERSGGRCEKCTAKLFPGNIEYGPEHDHGIPDGLGGGNDLGNCACLCRACHREKTRKDVAAIAKVKRMERLHLGAKTPGRSLPCGRASKFKKTFNHGVVPR